MSSEAYVNQRRSYDGNLCTVRYVGEVAGTNGQWLGVEWDDASRGKHNGEHAGVKYFSNLSRRPNASSFVRPTRRPDTPRDFVEAVRHKYASDFGAHGVYTVKGFQQADSSVRISGKDVEEVGFDKIRRQLANLRQLRIVLVDTLRIHRPTARGKDLADESSTDVYDTSPNVYELDLSRSLFEHWVEVLDICRQLPQLTSLRADGNRFERVEQRMSAPCLKIAPFTNIKTLGLDDTLLSWTDVAQICETMPTLTTLSACGNEYESLPEVAMPSSLTSVSLERNDFPSFQSLLSLARLNSLQKLSLKSNAISRWRRSDEAESSQTGTTCFPTTLTELDIAYNQLDEWSLIDQLVAIFPGLSTLRVAHNPLYDNLDGPDGKRLTPEDGYMLTLARIGRLERLNYSDISPKTRLNAELFYLSLIRRQIAQLPPTTDPASILAQHARYPELIVKYPDSSVTHTSPSTNRRRTQQNPEQPTKQKQINPNSLAANLVTLHITLSPSVSAAQTKRTCSPPPLPSVLPSSAPPHPPSFPPPPTKTTWTRRVPRSCSIYTLQGLIGKYFGVAPMSLRLVWETGEVDELDEVDGEGGEEEEEDWEEGGADVSTTTTSPAKAKAIKKTPAREEPLTPRIRSLGTWADETRPSLREGGGGGEGGEDQGEEEGREVNLKTAIMNLRVEFDDERVQRATRAEADARAARAARRGSHGGGVEDEVERPS